MIERGDCPDVNRIGYDGAAQGEYCELPFLMNERYFETCTRMKEKPDGAVITEGEYWCPSPKGRCCVKSGVPFHFKGVSSARKPVHSYL